MVESIDRTSQQQTVSQTAASKTRQCYHIKLRNRYRTENIGDVCAQVDEIIAEYKQGGFDRIRRAEKDDFY